MTSRISGTKSIAAKNSVASQMARRTRRIDGHHGSGVAPESSSSTSHLRMAAAATTLIAVPESFKEFEASSLYCSRCKRANPVRKRLLLVLPTGNKYDYTCSVCGSAVGGKTDNDTSDFYTRRPPQPGGLPPQRLR